MKNPYRGCLDVACELAGLDQAFADSLLEHGLVSALDRFVVLAVAPNAVLVKPYAIAQRVQGSALSLPPVPAKPAPPKPTYGPCRIYRHTACISLACMEDGFCRQTGEEIATSEC